VLVICLILKTDKGGRGRVIELVELDVSSCIGRALCVDGSVAGIIARSAGSGGNKRTLCSCSGKTVWEERSESKYVELGGTKL
jgi:copper chaperone for superoxide dismutase